MLVRSGKVEPYRRTYAKRLPKAPALLAELEVLYRTSLFDDEPLPVLAAPEQPKAPPRKREKFKPPRQPRAKIPPPSLPLAYPPTIADLLAGLGPTHEAIAERVGLSKPQVTNIICGRFGVSRPIARRVLELELCGKVGDGVSQAADFISAASSIPSLNFTPSMTFGNWF